MAAIDILVVVMHILVSQGTGGKHFGDRMGIHRSLGTSQDWWDMTSAAKEHAMETVLEFEPVEGALDVVPGVWNVSYVYPAGGCDCGG